MCTKMVQHSAKEVGKTYKSKCNKPEYKDGLCKYHYDRREAKLRNWIDRPEYREATQHDLDTGRSLKLRNENTHKLLKQIFFDAIKMDISFLHYLIAIVIH